MTKTRLKELCDIARRYDLEPFRNGNSAVYTLTYKGEPLFAHYVNGMLYDCIYKRIQFRFVDKIGRGPTQITHAYKTFNCNTIVWLIPDSNHRHYKDEYGENRSKSDCDTSLLCDYADVIPFA